MKRKNRPEINATKILNVIFGALNFLGFMVLAHQWSNGTVVIRPGEMEYKDFVSILLTAVTVILAILALFLAVAAIWGYKTIQEAAERAAREAAKERAEQAAREEAKRVALDICPTIAAREAQTIFMRSGALEGDLTDDLSNALAQGEEEAEGEYALGHADRR